MNYRKAEEYILSIPRFTKKNTWEDSRAFYQYLGKPGMGAKVIHVAGTNGKGSVCAYMASCLMAGGFSVGMFTSPHLVTMRERIRLDDVWISEEDFQEVFYLLEKNLSDYRRKVPGQKNYHPTFFEWLFFLGMLYFEMKKPQIIILETGLGGRLDATNVIDPPLACVITSIGLDHTEYLGNTCEQIGGEKAGIIKEGSRVIYCEMRQESDRVIEKKAMEKGCSCRKVKKTQNSSYDLTHKRIDFSFYSRYYGYIPLSLASSAPYQVENAVLALEALEESGFELTLDELKKGVAKCRWEGRMEEVLPGVYVDGAHNRDGVEAFLWAVRNNPCRGKRWLLFAVVADKEYRTMNEQVLNSGLFYRVYTAPLNHVRSLPKSELEIIFRDYCVSVADSVSLGLEEILNLRGKDDRVYVAGSLYLVGEVKEYLAHK